MSSQPNRSRVRGPRSALTSFLEEHGISARHIQRSRFNGSVLNNNNDNGQDEVNTPTSDQSEGNDDNALQSSASESASTNEIPNHTDGNAVESSNALASTSNGGINPLTTPPDSTAGSPSKQLAPANQLQQPNTSIEVVIPSKRKTPKTSSKSSSSKSQKQKSKKKKKDDSDNSDDSDFVPEFNGALRNSQSENSKMKNTLCLKCRNVIPYYRTSKISASLCEDCALTSIVNQRGNGRRSTGGRGRGRGRGRRKVASEFVYLNDEVGVPTLQNLCVKLICDHILDVEEFGDISPTALEKISKIICKHRKLDENTVRLFVGPEYDAIRLYDCTKLSPENLTDLALASSHIHTLHLSFVGQLCDSTLSVFADCLPLLKHLTLKGAYLVTDKAWGEFFRSIGKQLEYLELESAAKLERKGVRALVEVAAGVSIPVEKIVIPRVENDLVDDDEMDWTLTKQGSSSSAGPSYSRSSFLNGTSALIHLKLNDCPQLENSTVHLLQHLSQLQTLSLLESATIVTDETLTTLLSNYTNLTELYLSNAPLLTDESLVSIGKYAPKLTHLQLNQMENFTVEGVTSCLDHWASFIRSNTSGTTNANTKTESQYHQYLTFLDLTRSRAFNSTEILSPFLTFTGSSLQILNLNSLDSLSPDIFVTILEHCRNVEEMDICWVRCVDDVVMENLLTGLKLLRVVKIFGCHKVTECVVKKAGGWRNGSGELIKIVGSEFE